ncbi:Release factor glutamine methyltransferase [Buchnera aphidicola (Thelaxes suberi)]|uniref:peptide chain release factor N(5)-glutamine methyltransferase n=1 Tax=Buchnera aphidicola TaxID=9 RepID=UPI0034639BB5
MKIRDWKKISIKKLNYAFSAYHDVLILLSYVLNHSISWLIAFDDIELTIVQQKQLNKLLNRRVNNEPLNYIICSKYFWSLNFFLSKDVLIPRSDTEKLVEISLIKINMKKKQYILDLGTGSGNIAISIANECSNCHVMGIDYTTKIIKLAKYNANKLNIKNVFFCKSNWFSCLNNYKFNIIVSNPPYISIKEKKNLSKDIMFEPKKALFTTKKGLQDIEHIISNAKYYLLQDGWLILEHGWNQKNEVFNFFVKYKFTTIESYKDYNGYDRVIAGKL